MLRKHFSPLLCIVDLLQCSTKAFLKVSSRAGLKWHWRLTAKCHPGRPVRVSSRSRSSQRAWHPGPAERGAAGQCGEPHDGTIPTFAHPLNMSSLSFKARRNLKNCGNPVRFCTCLKLICCINSTDKILPGFQALIALDTDAWARDSHSAEISSCRTIWMVSQIPADRLEASKYHCWPEKAETLAVQNIRGWDPEVKIIYIW